jgi:hypothetical protein
MSVIDWKVTIKNWLIFCALDASRFTEAKTFRVAILLAIIALRNFAFWWFKFHCNEDPTL